MSVSRDEAIRSLGEIQAAAGILQRELVTGTTDGTSADMAARLMVLAEDVAAHVAFDCEEHYEVAVQYQPGGDFTVDTNGPHERYPDYASASAWAVRVASGIREVAPSAVPCVRVKRISTTWLMPEEPAERTVTA